MNVLVRELRANFKVLLIWIAVVVFFDVVGIMKFSGVEAGGVEMTQHLIDAFPPIVLAVLGIANLNMATFAGFYGVLMFYIGIMIAAYAMHLGLNAVSRESVDGTYEFLFVRPRSRYSILASKLLAALICLLLFCMVNTISSVGGYLTLDRPAEGETASASGLTNEPPCRLFVDWTMWLLMVGLVFLAVGAVLASLCEHPETASRIGNCSVLLCYLAAVAYDMFSDHACSWIARVLSPMRYWLPDQVLDGVFSVPYGILALGIVAFALTSSFAVFGKRDLTA